jgi:hypothetical protein
MDGPKSKQNPIKRERIKISKHQGTKSKFAKIRGYTMHFNLLFFIGFFNIKILEKSK